MFDCNISISSGFWFRSLGSGLVWAWALGVAVSVILSFIVRLVQTYKVYKVYFNFNFIFLFIEARCNSDSNSNSLSIRLYLFQSSASSFSSSSSLLDLTKLTNPVKVKSISTLALESMPLGAVFPNSSSSFHLSRIVSLFSR